MAKAVELAEAIVAVLNDARFSQPVTVERKAAPITNPLEVTKLLQVYVLTGTKRINLGPETTTRAASSRTYKPVLVVQKKLLGGEAAELKEVDALEQLVEELEGALEGKKLAGLEFIGFDEEQDRDSYGFEQLLNHHIFATAITLEYSD